MGHRSAPLRHLGEQAHVQILVAGENVVGKTLHAVSGDLTTEEALNTLLSGSGLTHKYVGDSSVALLPLSNADPQAATPGSAQPSEAGKGGQASPSSFLLAQATPGQTQGDASVEKKEKKQEEETSKIKEEVLQQVVVTGTHIKGVAPVGAPLLTIDNAEIQESGYTTTEDLIQSLPQNFRGGAGAATADANFQSGTNAGYNIAFGSGVNLRGLGNTATLVLVNGHRVASSGGGYFTDISTIPLSAIDHIDVLTDGASAIYGSEAIAGVINIVLKNDTQGVEVGARYGAAEGGFSTYAGTLQVGNQWTGGGFTMGADVAHQDTLDASKRLFTSSVYSPTSIFPAYDQTALTAAGHQQFGDRLEFHGDTQYTEKTVTDFNSSTGMPPFQNIDTKVDRWSASAGGSYRIWDSWILRYDVSAGEEVNNVTVNLFSPGGPASIFETTRVVERFNEQNMGVTGSLFLLPAGSVKLAVGATYRTENYEDYNVDLPYQPFNLPYSVYLASASRTVTSGYGEIRIPVFSELNAASGFQKLTLSVAARADDYSDFGRTTNPKYGFSWFPIPSLELRGAYSTSFRAPATGAELVASATGTGSVSVVSFPGPDGVTQVPLLELLGAVPGLQPETATNRTVGFDWKPSFASGLQLSFNYYDISYSKQIAAPPFLFNALSNPALASVVTKYPSSAPVQALVAAAVANGAVYGDYTGGAFGPNPLASTVYVYDLRIANLSNTDTSGLDIAARYRFTIGADQVDARIDATYISTFVTELTPGSPQISEVNTVGYPARLRLRGLGAWTHGPFVVSLAANYVNSYSDTSASAPRDVASYTTCDLTARYNFSRGILATLAATNTFNRAPPYVESGATVLVGSHYDPANSNPLGRLITFQIAKKW
jgi:iron complex outermembrane receptor protein